jgi:hypothetical protein
VCLLAPQTFPRFWGSDPSGREVVGASSQPSFVSREYKPEIEVRRVGGRQGPGRRFLVDLWAASGIVRQPMEGKDVWRLHDLRASDRLWQIPVPALCLASFNNGEGNSA